jgi:hypothetical protein
MIAATYARRSNDQLGVAEDAKSVTRQLETLGSSLSLKAGWWMRDTFSLTMGFAALSSRSARLCCADERAEAERRFRS